MFRASCDEQTSAPPGRVRGWRSRDDGRRLPGGSARRPRGDGAVYRADEEGLGRKVALKVIAPELAQDERFRERFLRESRIAASLDHPHIVPIYQAGEEEACSTSPCATSRGPTRQAPRRGGRAGARRARRAPLPGRGGARRRPRQRPRPPRRQALERPHRRAAGKRALLPRRLRPHQRTGSPQASRRGRGRRHARVRRSGADHRRRARRARGRVLTRLRPLRVPDRQRPSRGDRRRAALGTRARGADPALEGTPRASQRARHRARARDSPRSPTAAIARRASSSPPLAPPSAWRRPRPPAAASGSPPAPAQP